VNKKIAIKAMLIQGLILLSLGGWLLHLRIHPPFMRDENMIPFIVGIFSVFIVPLMFYFRRTFNLAYLINGFSVILGTILMAHFSIAHFSGPVTFQSIFTNTLLADIAILWGKFAFGKAIFDLELLRSDTDTVPMTRYWRYPNSGWWFVHLFGWAAVYTLGNIFWR
jgi:hypothetical protein